MTLRKKEEYLHRSPVHQKAHTSHIHKTHTGNLVSSPHSQHRFGLLVIHSKKIREDRDNIKHHHVTKKQSIAMIKLATLFNIEAAFSNFQAPWCVLYSEGIIQGKMPLTDILPTMLVSIDSIIKEALSIPQADATYYTLICHISCCVWERRQIVVCVIFNNDTGLGCMSQAGRRLEHTNVSGQVGFSL